MAPIQQLGARVRAVRIRRGWRQLDVAIKVGRNPSVISRIERGHLERVTIGTLLDVARALDIQVTLTARSRGADLDRLVSGRHAGLHESVARWFADDLPDWVLKPEVSFSNFGERGIIDIVAWHPGYRALLIIELKTDIVDVNELIGQMDQRRRLARQIAATQGWDPITISTWVIVAGGRTNRGRLAAHRALLRNAFPADGRSILGWLRRPERTIAALSLWQRVEHGAVRGGYAARHRVRRRAMPPVVEPDPVAEVAKRAREVRHGPTRDAGHGATRHDEGRVPEPRYGRPTAARPGTEDARAT